jgi:hypothetical protein
MNCFQQRLQERLQTRRAGFWDYAVHKRVPSVVAVVAVFALRKLRRRAQRQATATDAPAAGFTMFVPPALRAGFSQRENRHPSLAKGSSQFPGSVLNRGARHLCRFIIPQQIMR